MRPESASVIYHTSVPSETPALGVSVFDTYGISTEKLVLTLLIFGLTKRWHFKSLSLKLDVKQRL